MTEPSDETTPSSPAPKKSLRMLFIKKEPMEIPSLGVVLVDRLTLGVMRKLAKLLEQDKDASDEAIARTLFGAVIYFPGIDESEGDRLLNSSELSLVTDEEIITFAKVFNERQGWSSDAGEVMPISLLAKKLREELLTVTESLNKTLNLGSSIFSENTRRLMTENSLIAERLKDYAGTSKFAKQFEIATSPIDKLLKSINSSPAIEAVRKSIEEREKWERKFSNPAIERQQALIERTAMPDFSISAPRHDVSAALEKAAETSPIARSARSLSSLDAKVAEAIEVAKEIADSHGKNNEIIISGLSDLSVKHEETNNHIIAGLKEFNVKRQQDEASATKSLKLAVGGIFASVLLSLVAIGQDYCTNRSNDREQKSTKALLEKQVSFAKEAATNQNKTTQALEGRVKELEGKLAAQASREARAKKKTPTEQK